MKSDSQPTGVSTFAIRTSQRPCQKLQKSFHLSAPKNEFQNIFPSLLKKNKTRQHTGDTDSKGK